jgi:hypothetical protein
MGMGAALEFAKPPAAAWLDHHRRSRSWGIKASLACWLWSEALNAVARFDSTA